MKILFKSLSGIILFFVLTFLFSSCNNNGIVTPVNTPTFSKIYGGSNSDVASVLLSDYDGYLVCGSTTSFGAGNDDAYAMKLNENGEAAWMKTYGGSGFDVITCAAITDDDGFIMAGTTTSFGASQYDVFAVKCDAGGNKIWAKYYKISGNDYVFSVRQTDDGGYAFAGYSNSYGAGNNDVMLLKVDSLGNIMFGMVYGGPWDDFASSMVYFEGGGYNIAGTTFSAGSNGDMLLLCVSDEGNLFWAKACGGDGLDQAFDLCITQDGVATNGLIMSGFTQSFGMVSGDAYIVKTDINGYLSWSKTIGSTDGMEQSLNIIQLADGGFLSTGFSNKYGAGLNDIMNIRLYGDGAYKWCNVYGTVNNETGKSIIESDDGSLFSIGNKEINTFVYDVLINRIKEDGSSCSSFSVAPNGGDPASIVIDANNIVQSSVSTYESNEAAVMVNPISLGSTVICNNP